MNEQLVFDVIEDIGQAREALQLRHIMADELISSFRINPHGYELMAYLKLTPVMRNREALTEWIRIKVEGREEEPLLERLQWLKSLLADMLEVYDYVGNE